MDVWLNLLLWIHIMAVVGGGALSVSMPAIGKQLAGATPDQRAKLMAVVKRLVMAGRGAVVVLLVTGPLMFWLKFDFTAPSEFWFTLKMVLVLILVIGLVVGGISMKKAQSGDQAALKLSQRMGMMNSAALLLIVLAAVFAFN